MELHFAGKARPEVLSGLGVYAKLDELVNDRRLHFQKDKRESQKKELERDRHNAFLQVLNEEGPTGILRINGTILLTKNVPVWWKPQTWCKGRRSFWRYCWSN